MNDKITVILYIIKNFLMLPDKMILCVTMSVFVMLFAFFNLLLKKC